MILIKIGIVCMETEKEFVICKSKQLEIFLAVFIRLFSILEIVIVCKEYALYL